MAAQLTVSGMPIARRCNETNGATRDVWRDLSAQLIDRFMDVLAVDYRFGPATRAQYRSDLRSLERWLQQNSRNSLCCATDANLVRYLREAHARSSGVAKQRRRSMRRFYAWLRAVGCREDDPMSARCVQRWWKQKQAKRSVPPAHSMSLRSALNSRDQLIFALMLTCGLGVQDVAAVKIQDLRLNECVVRLGDGRQVALPATLVQLLQQYIHGARERILTNRRSKHLFPRRTSGAISPERWRLAASGLTFKFWRRLNKGARATH